MHWLIDTRDKPGLLWAILNHFSTDTRVSFEGNLEGVALTDVAGASTLETSVLCRQTRQPMLDFVIIPVTEEAIRLLRACISRSGLFQDGGAIVHVQVEHAGHLVLGAYDNFHKDCVVAYEPTPESLLKQLENNGVIRSYEIAA